MTSFLKNIKLNLPHKFIIKKQIMAPKRKVEELDSRGIITNTPEKTVVPGEETSGIVNYIQVDSIHT